MAKPNYVFSKRDYNNPNGMLTSVWGPSFWHVLHTISVNYPLNPTCEDKEHYKTFIMSLKHVLPCKYCRDNLTKNLKILPLNPEALKNRVTFSKWMYKLHEVVNKYLGKKSGLKFRDVQDRYEHFRARCSSDRKSNNIKAPPKNVKTGQKGGGNNNHLGCTNSIYGVKARCKLQIVPQSHTGDSISIHNKCKGKR
jgi:hypothetical protein